MTVKEYLQQNDISKWVNGEQGRIDLKILPYLQDTENGFFVEAGALDGLFMTNTKILEDCGWNGLLIEPSHNAVLKCRENRTCLVEECALVSKSYREETVRGDFFFGGENGGAGAWSSIERNHYGGVVSVPAKTLTTVLMQHGVKKVDLLSLDVEGYELEVLKGTDFREVDIRFILMEVNSDQYSLADVESVLSDYKNLGCISNFSFEANPGWNGLHQDYLFERA